MIRINFAEQHAKLDYIGLTPIPLWGRVMVGVRGGA